MALSQRDLLRLLEPLRSVDGLELVRSGVAERMLQELIEAEATARISAEWNEHTETRTASRNRHRGRRCVPAVPAQRKARREYENRVSALAPIGP